MAQLPTITGAQREVHLRWASDLTQTPTAAGKEQRAIAWIEKWVADRPRLSLKRDAAGNPHIAAREKTGPGPTGAQRPLYFTAHLDHPAFVVERIIAPAVVELSFRGGVMDDYFKDGGVLIWDRDDEPFRATLTGESTQVEPPFKRYLAEVAGRGAPSISIGDVAVWDIGSAEVIDGNLHTTACDDLAAAAAALAAMDVLLAMNTDAALPSLLFTRAEEIGFIGAIAACRHQTMPRAARVIALENSRSFADSPIGGGPIVRVGDRLSVFSPSLTDAIAKRAEEIGGGPASVTASQKVTALPAWKWQRKLMAGGACEASVFCANGYEATCVCLPLGNYHNMADLTAVQAGTNTTAPRVAREYISVSDYHGLVDLLVACGISLPTRASMTEKFDKLWEERAFVLES